MKVLCTILILVIICFITSFALSQCNIPVDDVDASPTEDIAGDNSVLTILQNDKSWMKIDTDIDTTEITLCDELPVISADDIPESEIKREQRISEVVMLWEMFFDDDSAPPSDPRRHRFEEFAGYVVDVVRMYEERQTDIGGQLPKGFKTHLIIATMISRESSVTFEVIGRCGNKREVGLLQLHGKSLAGFTREQVARNPKLGIILGVRWLAVQIKTCFPNGAPELFTYEDWLGPLSVYAGGQNAIRKDGSCKRFSVAHDRVDRMILYESRINYEMSLRDDI